MKLRVLDAMGDALGLVKKSDLGGATALIRKALSGETARGDERRRSRSAHRQAAKVIPLPRAPPVGRDSARSARPADQPPGRPDAPERGPTPDLGERFLKRTYAAPRARSTTGSMSRPITKGGSWRLCSCCTAARRTRKISRSARR